MLSSESSSSFTALESALIFEKKRDDILITVSKAALLAEPVMASVASPALEEPVEKAEVAGEPMEAEEVDPELASEEAPEEAPAEEQLLGSALDQSDAQDERPDDQQPESKRAVVILREVQKLLTGCISLLQAKLPR